MPKMPKIVEKPSAFSIYICLNRQNALILGILGNLDILGIFRIPENIIQNTWLTTTESTGRNHP